MLQKLKKRESGFTIIEVLIVLAIAGLIMLIVFLAVPALQRNSRNRGRENDASLLATAVNDCITNKNGATTNCVTLGTDNVSYNATRANQLTTAPAASALAGATVSQARWLFSNTCVDGAPQSSTNTRDFAVTFRVETAQGNTLRCITS